MLDFVDNMIFDVGEGEFASPSYLEMAKLDRHQINQWDFCRNILWAPIINEM